MSGWEILLLIVKTLLVVIGGIGAIDQLPNGLGWLFLGFAAVGITVVVWLLVANYQEAVEACARLGGHYVSLGRDSVCLTEDGRILR